MSREWIEKNLVASVGITVRNDILLRGYARHLFFSPLYHPCSAQHARAHLDGLPQTAHADHDAIHYNEHAVKAAVNRRKTALRARHGVMPTLVAE